MIVIISHSLANKLRDIVFSRLRQENFENLLFLLFPLFVNNRTMAFHKIDKGTQISVFITISILIKFFAHTCFFTKKNEPLLFRTTFVQNDVIFA